LQVSLTTTTTKAPTALSDMQHFDFLLDAGQNVKKNENKNKNIVKYIVIFICPSGNSLTVVGEERGK